MGPDLLHRRQRHHHPGHRLAHGAARPQALLPICTTLFTVSSFLSGLAPNLETLVLFRTFQGLGGGPVVPMAQALMWEIFPLKQRGMAMAVWGSGS